MPSGRPVMSLQVLLPISREMTVVPVSKRPEHFFQSLLALPWMFACLNCDMVIKDVCMAFSLLTMRQGRQANIQGGTSKLG
ncbi:unnamed protein product [Pylaiella littoralis]